MANTVLHSVKEADETLQKAQLVAKGSIIEAAAIDVEWMQDYAKI